MSGRRISAGEVLGILLELILLVACVAVSIGIPAYVLSDQLELRCRPERHAVTCSVIHDRWLLSSEQTYPDVTGVDVVTFREANEVGEYEVFAIRLTDATGRYVSERLGRWDTSVDAGAHADRLTAWMPGPGDPGFVEVIEPRWPLVQLVAALLFASFVVFSTLLAVTGPCVSAVTEALATRIDTTMVWWVAFNVRIGRFEAAPFQRRLDRMTWDLRAAVGRSLIRTERTTGAQLSMVYDLVDAPRFDKSPIAFHPNVPGELVERMLVDPVGVALARHPATPPQLLTRLAGSPLPQVRETVAADPRVDPEVLLALAVDRDPDVRRAVAANPRATGEVRALVWLAG